MISHYSNTSGIIKVITKTETAPITKQLLYKYIPARDYIDVQYNLHIASAKTGKEINNFVRPFDKKKTYPLNLKRSFWIKKQVTQNHVSIIL